jgi:sugar phosphate isomerase/epimerase
MLKAVSTHVLLEHRLHPGMLDQLAHVGVEAVEIFAARNHFDYTSHAHIEELAGWFRSNPVQLFSMHGPLFTDMELGRSGAPQINLLHPEKSRRIDSMDEIKRVLEVAELLPFKKLILHLGESKDEWNPRALEYSITALEHLQAFARPLGVGLLVENLVNEPAQPQNLLETLRSGHFTDIGVCLDTGHAHLGDGVPAAISALGERIESVHIHDNGGNRDEHLWPGEGTIDWPSVMPELKNCPKNPVAVLEIHYTQQKNADESKAGVIATKLAETFTRLGL